MPQVRTPCLTFWRDIISVGFSIGRFSYVHAEPLCSRCPLMGNENLHLVHLSSQHEWNAINGRSNLNVPDFSIWRQEKNCWMSQMHGK